MKGPMFRAIPKSLIIEEEGKNKHQVASIQDECCYNEINTIFCVGSKRDY